MGKDVPIMKRGYFGEMDLSERPLSWPEKLNQDKIVLCELLSEFCILKEVKMAIPAVFELSSGLMELVRTKIPIWLVLGCQICLDIHHTMLSDLDMALKDLWGSTFPKLCKDYFNFSEGMSIESWSDNNDQALGMIKLEAGLWVNQEFFGVTRKRLFKKFNPPEAAT
ncbi:unnamed protein product [Calypogeia fissa]